MPSETAITGQAKAVLLLLLTGVICNAVVIPYISVYRAPLKIALSLALGYD